MVGVLLAFLPGGDSKHHQNTVKTKFFAVVADQIQGIGLSENNKRFENETEDPHPLTIFEASIPAPAPQWIPYFAFSLQLDIPAYYPIRAPPIHA
jgi:ubiquitin-protein ligase